MKTVWNFPTPNLGLGDHKDHLLKLTPYDSSDNLFINTEHLDVIDDYLVR